MADTARIIARWKNGGRFSIGDLVHAYTDIPPVMRPSLQRWEVLLAFVESIVLEPAIADYGARMGLDKDSLVTVPVQQQDRGADGGPHVPGLGRRRKCG